MATQNFYFLDATASGSSHGTLQIDGSAPSVSTMATKVDWTTLNAANEYSPLLYNTTQGSGTFGTTSIPAAGVGPATSDCFRTASKINGTYANANWTIKIAGINTVVGTSGGWFYRMRFWAATSADGSTGARELTTANISTTTNNYTSTTQQNRSVTWTPGAAVALKNEYFFIKWAWVKSSGAVTSTGSESALVQDGTNAVITTPNFVPDSDVFRRPADRLHYLRR